MKLSQEAIQEFAEIYKQEFGEEISLDEAEIMAGRVIEFVSLISRPPPTEDEPYLQIYG